MGGINTSKGEIMISTEQLMYDSKLEFKLASMVNSATSDAETKTRVIRHLINLISEIDNEDLQFKIVDQITMVISEFTVIRF